MDFGEDEELEVYIMLVFMCIEWLFNMFTCCLGMLHIAHRYYEKNLLNDRTFVRNKTRIEHLDRLMDGGDTNCIEQLRMDRRTFGILCELLRTNGKLKEDGQVTVEEQVAMFLHTLAHHVKNRVIKFRFMRSRETVSGYFHAVLNAMMLIQSTLLRAAEPITENCTDHRWKYFKGCLGALDGTYIKVRVPEVDKPRYRTRNGEIATNVLGVCSFDMKFTFVMPGWEGSATDSRVLRDAVNRRHGLRVPTGYYYLVDAEYTNGEGFLAPYRDTRYHLSEWREGLPPTTPEEYFNMKHSAARDVIERTFGLLKLRWAILRSPSFYPIKTQGRSIIACCLLHNLIRREMSVDPLEGELDGMQANTSGIGEEGCRTPIETSDQWTDWRNNLARQMFDEWRDSRGQG